jgi:cobalt-zinc-cadmium efflux system membrane fusion protein
VAKEVGDQVATGELLAVLDSAELAEAKAGYLTVTQEVALARLDLQRAELLARNTSQALTFLQQEPPLAKLGELEGLDLGEQRRALLGAYMAMVGSRTTLERKQKLHGQQIASDAELQEAQLAHEQARAEFLATRDALGYDQQRSLLAAQRELALAEIRQRAAERHLHALGLDEAQVAASTTQQDHDLSRLEVVAPMAGTVIERHLVPGERASEDEAAFVIADFSVVWARLTVYPKDLGLVQPGLPVRLALTGTDATIAGIIAMVSPQVDEATRTASARVVIANPGGQWRAGAFITGEVAVGSKAAALVVPRAAVVTLEEGPAVFVQTAEGLAPRPVRLGMGDATQVEVLDGLQPGETYVARNAFALKAELNKAAFGHAGHGH